MIALNRAPTHHLGTALAVVLSLLADTRLGAQAPDSVWTRSYGSSANEVAGTMSVNSLGNNMAGAAFDAVDGGLYVCTYTPGSDGWVSTNNGSDDIWVLKLDGITGDTLWTRVIGSSGTDRVYRMRAVSTGGVILAGRTTIGAGLCTGYQGQTDGLLIRLDADGNSLWTRCLGGSGQDFLYDVAENPAGNFVACGESTSSNGDLAGAGNGLAWVQFVNGGSGAPVLSFAPVGPNGASPNGLENFTIITRMANESAYLLGGFTSPDFNDFNQDDIWVAKMTSQGNVEWSRTYGSTNARDGSAALVEVGGGEFIIAGLLGGSGGFPGYLGGPGDGLLIRCDAQGNAVWTRNYGGSDWEYFNDALLDADGNLLVAGFSRSTNGDLANTTAYGNADYWLLKVDPTTGDTLWTKRMGGPGFDAALAMASSGTTDEIALAGRSDDNGGWVSGNNGGRDLWVVRLSGDITTAIVGPQAKGLVSLYPNPTQDLLRVQSDEPVIGWRIHDLSGRLMLERGTVQETLLTLPVQALAAGTYVLELLHPEDQRSQHRFMVQR
jgi:hypothetical protein